ncbi:MAG: SNF2-related protein [Alphaproteobacteria bacterium]
MAIRLKQLFPRIRKSDPPPYRFPDDLAHAADLSWFVSRYPLAAADDDLAALHEGRLAFDAHQAEMERLLAPAYTPPAYAGLRPGQTVRHYQAQAVELLIRSGGLLLGDEVGLGKTFTTCAAALKEGALPAAIVCHAHLSKQWCEVVESFTTLRAHAIKGTRPYNLPAAGVYVFRYSQIFGWADMFETIGPGLVAFDEIQELRRGLESDKGRAAARLAAAGRYRLGLSATPIYNYGTEIWRIMDYLRPGLLGDGAEFTREWTGGMGKISDPSALGAYLREQYAFLRRTKRDVGQEVPPVNRIVDTVAHDQDSLSSIDEIARALAVKTTMGEFTERGRAARELDMLVRHRTGVAKAKSVAAFVRILVESGEPVVLVGWHREVYDIWLTELRDLQPVMFTGSETPGAKAQAKARFVEGKTSLLIMSLRSGAGLDGLQFRCSTMVFGELDWSPGVHHQCIGRLDREGQTAPVTAIFLVTDEGSDPPMMEVLGLKASEAARIVDPSLGVQTVHSDYSHVQALVKRYLAKKERAHG